MKDQLEVFYKEYNKLTEKDVEIFKNLVAKLISVNYLTAYKEEDKKDYYFICNHLDCFMNYFSLGGWELLHYSNQRTIVLQSLTIPKISLNKNTSIILLILRLLYTQKLHDISLDSQINVTVLEVQEKYEQLAISTSERLKVGEISEAFRLLKRHNIIDFKGTDFQNDSFALTIYPTIQYAVGISDVKVIIDKISSYKEKEDNYEEIEEN